MSTEYQRPAVTHLIKQLQVALRAALDEALGPLGLTAPEWAALTSLKSNPGLTSAELARTAFVRPQSMTPILQTLRRKGLVVRKPHPEGGRAISIELTARGQAAFKDAASFVGIVEERLLNLLNETERHGFRELLATCLHSLKTSEPGNVLRR